MSGIIVDEDYTINERYGTKKYRITIDSPGYNQPIHHWDAECKVTRSKKIEKLRQEAREYVKRMEQSDEAKYKKVEL